MSLLHGHGHENLVWVCIQVFDFVSGIKHRDARNNLIGYILVNFQHCRIEYNIFMKYGFNILKYNLIKVFHRRCKMDQMFPSFSALPY